jgi:hypothetical protein
VVAINNNKKQTLVMKQETQRNAAAFSLGSIFGGKDGATTTTTKTGAGLEPHPSVRDHISPLNRLAPGAAAVDGGDEENALPVHPDVRSGVLDNGLPYIILPNKSPPGRFEAHLQVFSGSGMYIVIYVVLMLTAVCLLLTPPTRPHPPTLCS